MPVQSKPAQLWVREQFVIAAARELIADLTEAELNYDTAYIAVNRKLFMRLVEAVNG